MPGNEFSKTRLRRLREGLTTYVERGTLPGLVALVARGEAVHAEVIGTRTFEGGAPVRRDTLFRISSMTKPIAAAAAMLLVEECKLRLDDPVNGFFPELANRRVLKRLDGPLDETVPAQRPITLRDLLTFRLGFGLLMASPDDFPILKAALERQIGMGPPAPGSMPTPDEWLQRLGALPLMHQPGEKWLYNTGSDVLGVLIARASGQPLEVFLRERIFAPLGMKDTGFHVPAEKLARLGPCYWNDFATGALATYDAPEGQWSQPPRFPSAAGGLVSTADDYLAFARMLMNEGKHRRTRILSRASVELMTSDQLTPEQKARSGLTSGFFDNHGWGFGMGVRTRRDDLGNVGQYGWDGGMGTIWRNDPREDLTLILLTPRMWTSPAPPEVCRDFWTLAYQALGD